MSVPQTVPGVQPIKLEAKVSAADFISYNNNLLGRILTVIDATGLEPEAKKAVKSLIKQDMWATYHIVWKWLNEIVDIDAGVEEGKGQSYPPFPFDNMAHIE